MEVKDECVTVRMWFLSRIQQIASEKESKILHRKSEANGKIMRAVSENAKKLSEIWRDGQNFESASCVSFS